MGASISTIDKLGENEALKTFCGLEPISDNDPFWNHLLSFNFKPPILRVDSKFLDEGLSDTLASLVHNTVTTGNFAAFIRVFLRRVSELDNSVQCKDKIFLWQTTNALIILRYCCRYFAHVLSEREFMNVFCKNILLKDGNIQMSTDSEPPFENPAEELIVALIGVLVQIPQNDLTAATHLETLSCLLSLLSSQLFSEKPFNSSILLRYMHSTKCLAPGLIRQLLTNFTDGIHMKRVANSVSEHGGGGSLVLGLAASFWNVVTQGYPDSNEESVYEPTVASQSLLVLLVIVCHTLSPDELSGNDSNGDVAPPNGYRDALFSFTNSQEKSSLATPSQAAVTFKLDYSRLFDVLCKYVQEEGTLLLLYLLLHRNLAFRNYVLSRVNIDPLVLPILKVLYKDASQSVNCSHHIYLALINLLILSEDDFFCKVVHETMVSDLDWMTEPKSFSEISLGGLIILVLIKTIQINIVKVRDRYLHTNCLAALANMSAHFKHLHAVVAQKLVTLLELLWKRHTRAVEHLRKSVEYGLQTEGVHTQNNDIAVLEEGIRMILEIINSCLSHGVHNNPHLIYTLLYKRDLFKSFSQNSTFQDVVHNIEIVLNHFSVRVKNLEQNVSVNDVLEIIQKGALQWSNDKLKKFPELKFKYVEDDSTDEFFVPYAWTLVYKHSAIYWEPTKIKLFNAKPIFGNRSEAQIV